MIYSVGTDHHKVISEEIKRDPNIRQIETLSKSRNLEETKVGFDKDNRNEQDFYLSEKKISQLVKDFNEKIESHNKRLEYSIHEKTNRLLVKVIDTQTEEVIKEIPDEKLMDMMADFFEITGILIDEKI